MSTKSWLENLKGRDHLEVIGVDEKIILEWIFGKWGCKLWTGFMWLKIGSVTGCFGQGKELSSSLKGG